MKITLSLSALILVSAFILIGFNWQEEKQWSLKTLTPEHYHYAQAETCINCKQTSTGIMKRAVGVDISSGVPVVDSKGWLGSVHARSQSHDDRVNTVCAWCHAPTAKGATKDKDAAKPIEKGTWGGVTCGACHPSKLNKDKRKSPFVNFTPGSDPTVVESYIFHDRSDGKQMNKQCRYCHHEVHDLTLEIKQEMYDSGELRCIDCHMAGYGGGGKHPVERYHNMKVEANLPYSCNGAFGTNGACHSDTSTEWMVSKLPEIKGPRKEW